ncbi:hypothetical protein [Phytohabitans aurantiacus]|jgi:hypothetical protein|uniref:Uncharacterized protein n=1 Tax=Phytohabitans aurantiacus TaxID=3016789 RepID=A0ABQ5QQ34_9ACTN|nr:hypothetical protein [Phytohabitans aurantiacus]GLH96334.1 hypothetical protein Pa4123_16080 [Phytohabitans aurantiacus]
MTVELSGILGEWRNANRHTFGVRRLAVGERDGRVWTHVWCRDPEADHLIDWGEAPAEAIYTDGPRSNRACAYRVFFDLGHAEVQLQFNVMHLITVCAAYTRFTDGSGRRGYFSREYMHRRGEMS